MKTILKDDLTPTQAEVLDAIVKLQKIKDPSLSEVAKYLKRSKAAVYKTKLQLKKKGWA